MSPLEFLLWCSSLERDLLGLDLELRLFSWDFSLEDFLLDRSDLFLPLTSFHGAKIIRIIVMAKISLL